MKKMDEWNDFFANEKAKPYWNKLISQVNESRQKTNVFPNESDVFRLFELIKPKDVKLVIIGQEPYHGFGQANGLAFSVYNNVKTPPSLKNIFNELKSDLNINHFAYNDLSGWVEQGVFLINTCLTVEEGKPGSHANYGWEIFVKNCLDYLNQINDSIIYLLMGKWAKKMFYLLETQTNRAIITGHPSPFSYEKYFKNTKPFSQINKLLDNPIDWSK